MNELKPFFTYFGGKYRLAPKYPKPMYNTIVEPFAGSAGYSLRYPEREVILNDLDPVISGIWEYLINVKEAIQNWTEKHLGTRLDVTNVKTMDMECLYDDRARQVLPNEGIIV